MTGMSSPVLKGSMFSVEVDQKLIFRFSLVGESSVDNGNENLPVY